MPATDSYVPRRCAVSDDEACAASNSAPRRAMPRFAPFRIGIVAFLSATMSIIAGATFSALTGAAQASNSQIATAIAAPFDRLSDVSRDQAREALDKDAITQAVMSRETSLALLEQDVAKKAATDNAAARRDSLSDTQQDISKEAKRLDAEKNKLTFPANGKPGSPWGMRFHPILRISRMHWGFDVGASCGSPIRAVYDGVVTYAGYNSGAGNHVKIHHGVFRDKALQTSSFHMTRFIVHAGQHVRKGQVIGYVGNTGLSTECHLHFETFHGGVNVNPATLFKN